MIRFQGQRAGESGEAFALRRRHHDALVLARELVARLEALRGVAEADPPIVPDAWTSTEAWELAEAIAAVEAARERLTVEPRRGA